MQNQRFKFTFCSIAGIALLAVGGLFGCRVVEYFTPEQPPYDAELYEVYDRIELKVSNSADVFAVIHKPQYEVLSQSKSVIASQGQKKRGYKVWFNMAAFGENEATVRHKYLLIADDRINLLEEPRKRMSFDCEMMLESDILDEPYANENARRIAILKRVRENARKDKDQVGSDNKMLDICGMLVNQALEAALVKLESSPVLASKLSEPAGLEFSHISLDRGRIQMLSDSETVKVRMRLGSLAKRFERQAARQAGEAAQ